MNERILELSKEAGMTRILDEHAHEYGNGMFENTPYPAMDKFVELIVKECIDAVSDCSVEYCTRPQLVSEIKAHFGVKE
jgi:hypothetical protein